MATQARVIANNSMHHFPIGTLVTRLPEDHEVNKETEATAELVDLALGTKVAKLIRQDRKDGGGAYQDEEGMIQMLKAGDVQVVRSLRLV